MTRKSAVAHDDCDLPTAVSHHASQARVLDVSLFALVPSRGTCVLAETEWAAIRADSVVFVA
jgi:hypothetical protein